MGTSCEYFPVSWGILQENLLVESCKNIKVSIMPDEHDEGM